MRIESACYCVSHLFLARQQKEGVEVAAILEPILHILIIFFQLQHVVEKGNQDVICGCGGWQRARNVQQSQDDGNKLQ